MDRKAFIEKCDEVRRYWRDRMPMLVMEEAGELIQAISKYERYVACCDFGLIEEEKKKEVTNNLIEELGDMYISLMALQLQYGSNVEEFDADNTIEDLIERRIEEKLNKKY